jgi:hypothetical protein
MANFVVTYDLNRPRPTHREMDEHLDALGPTFVRARILETVWYVAGPTTAAHLRQYVRQILGQDDLLLIAEMRTAAWTKLLVDNTSFKDAFERNQVVAA